MLLPGGRPIWYGLDGQPIEAHEADALLRDYGARRIATTMITTDKGRCSVSTVFLVLDHGFMDEKRPVLWETMTFGGPDDDATRRYASRESAIAGHAEALAECRIAIDLDGAKIIAEETLNGRADVTPPDTQIGAPRLGTPLSDDRQSQP